MHQNNQNPSNQKFIVASTAVTFGNHCPTTMVCRRCQRLVGHCCYTSHPIKCWHLMFSVVLQQVHATCAYCCSCDANYWARCLPACGTGRLIVSWLRHDASTMRLILPSVEPKWARCTCLSTPSCDRLGAMLDHRRWFCMPTEAWGSESSCALCIWLGWETMAFSIMPADPTVLRAISPMPSHVG